MEDKENIVADVDDPTSAPAVEETPTDAVTPPEPAEAEKEETPKEEDVSKLDLTQPEHLRSFRNTYERNKVLLGEATTKITLLEQENEQLRENNGKGFFLDTNQPLEIFKDTVPDSLRKMAEEEPDYYDLVANDIIQNHFWESTGELFTEFIPRQLDLNDENDRFINDQAIQVWDALTRRLSRGQMTGEEGVMVMEVLEKSPDICQAILDRYSGKTRYDANAQTASDGAPASAGGYQPNSAPQLMSVEQISNIWDLDPSSESDMAKIRNIQNAQRQQVAGFQQQMALNQQLQQQVRQLQTQLESSKKTQAKDQAVSEEELTKQANVKLTNTLTTALRSDIQTRYGNSVTKEKVTLLTKLEPLVEARLATDPNYQKGKSIALAWVKQAMSTNDEVKKERWNQKGMDALAALVPIRLRAIDAEARELIGPIRAQADNRAKKTAATPRAHEINPGGRTAPVKKESPNASVGDMNEAKRRIQEAARQAGFLR